jgi:hypothetical protein
MIELPKQPLQPVSDQGDVLLAYGGTLLDAADQALGKVQGIGNATRLITAVLNVDVNATAINADLNVSIVIRAPNSDEHLTQQTCSQGMQGCI